jgi:hypothetical protein
LLRVTELLDLALRALPALVPLITLLVTLVRGPGALRSRIKHDIELLVQLPESAPARDALLSIINSDIETLGAYHTAKRDWSMFVVAIICAPLLGYLAVWLVVEQDGWWTVPVAFVSGLFAVIFVYGIFEAGERVPRDEHGKRIDPGKETKLRDDSKREAR